MVSKSMRRGRRRKGDPFAAPEIPWDLLIEILTRLPDKSLMRFKCVSKLWSSLIRCRYFSNRYFTLASPRRPSRLYITVVDQLQSECCSLLLEVCNKPHKSLLLSLKSSSSNTANKYFYQDVAVPGMGGRNVVILRGLLLYNVCSKACIYNPTTRQSLYLPAVKSTIFSQKRIHSRVVYSFGHDPVLDQYKVFCTLVTAFKNFKRITSEHWVLVVLEAGGGSWKRLQFGLPHYPTGHELCFDGVIYYLASTGMRREILVSFDVRCEKLNMVQVPHAVSEFVKDAGLIQYGGKPTIFDYTNLGGKGYGSWKMLETGRQNHWFYRLVRSIYSIKILNLS